MNRPLPPATALSAPFWKAAGRGELLVCECDGCHRRFFGPEPLCPTCGSTEWRWVPSPGTGTVYSFTMVHQSPLPSIEAPYVLAIVDLDDGCTMLTNIVGDATTLAIGARVSVSFTPAGEDGGALPTFELVASTEQDAHVWQLVNRWPGAASPP